MYLNKIIFVYTSINIYRKQLLYCRYKHTLHFLPGKYRVIECQFIYKYLQSLSLETNSIIYPLSRGYHRLSKILGKVTGNKMLHRIKLKYLRNCLSD